jgi:hypothetical protein
MYVCVRARYLSVASLRSPSFVIKGMASASMAVYHTNKGRDLHLHNSRLKRRQTYRIPGAHAGYMTAGPYFAAIERLNLLNASWTNDHL